MKIFNFKLIIYIIKQFLIEKNTFTQVNKSYMYYFGKRTNIDVVLRFYIIIIDKQYT